MISGGAPLRHGIHEGSLQNAVAFSQHSQTYVTSTTETTNDSGETGGPFVVEHYASQCRVKGSAVQCAFRHRSFTSAREQRSLPLRRRCEV